MGCDIHMYREVRDKNGDWQPLRDVYKYFDFRWENDPDEPDSGLSSLKIPDTGRDYALFGILSEGVRCEVSPNLGEHGLPNDISSEIEAEADVWGGDGHSHSYATLEELDEIWQETGGKFEFPDEDAYSEADRFEDFFVSWVDRYVRPFAWDGDDSIRIVYWFDN